MQITLQPIIYASSVRYIRSGFFYFCYDYNFRKMKFFGLRGVRHIKYVAFNIVILRKMYLIIVAIVISSGVLVKRIAGHASHVNSITWRRLSPQNFLFYPLPSKN